MDPAATANKMLAGVSVTGNGRADFPLRAFFGHHKCATGWIDHILMEICFRMGIRFRIVHEPAHFQERGSLGALVHQEHVDFLAYTNADQDYIADLSLYRGFHVVRDPRDVLVSAYYSHLYSHSTQDWPELDAYRSELKRLSKEEGLFREMEFGRHRFEGMYQWDYQQEHVLELKMEDLTRNPVDGFLQIARFLDILDGDKHSSVWTLVRAAILKMNRLNQRGRRFMPGKLPMFPVPRHRLLTIPAAVVAAIVQQKSFEKMSGGRHQGQENVRSHYRKGVPGDWKNHFSEDHKRVFKRDYGDLLIKLGYESDGDW